ncbi:MAG: twin-arginine translocase TatA/TatE family subunit [Bdellovibrionota bacterium]|jgi:TatA/E family protein of Tat protein translocase|nr:twin-arginine translocase TatA/TatE family subunit [Bdellovibrionota bacterium]
MFGLGAGEILIILAFALIFIGPKKLPELARNLGKGIREFQKAKDELMNHVHSEADDDHHASLTGVNEADDEVIEEVAAMKEALQKKSEEKSS